MFRIVMTAQRVTAHCCSTTGCATHIPSSVQRNTADMIYVRYRHWSTATMSTITASTHRA